MHLSDVFMIFVFLAFTSYILLDGYDLGIGVLTLFERDDQRRRDMHELVAWLWDGNESWIVLLALTLWAGVPLVVGVALPAVYIVLIPMLWSLIGRGVATELIDHHEGWHRVWGTIFGVGSLLAGFCQGAAFGGIVAGLGVHNGTFSGGPFTFLHHGYAVLTGLTAVTLYAVAGSAWLYFKTDGEVQRRAARAGRIAIVALTVGTAGSWALLTSAGTRTLHPGAAARLPVWIVGAAVLGAGLILGYVAFSRGPAAGRSDRSPVIAALGVYVGGMLLAGGLLYPRLIPPDVTVHDAASPHTTLLFLMCADGVFVPLYIIYQLYGYHVFRGKLKVKPGEAAA